MKILHILTSLASMLLIASMPLAEDYVIVSSDKGYRLAENGVVLQTDEYLTMMRTEEQRGDYLIVRTLLANPVRIHAAQVYRTSTLGFIGEDDIDSLSRLLKKVQAANLANADDDLEKATALLKEASEFLSGDRLQNTPLKAWLLAERAYLELPDGNTKRALRLLDKADASLSALNAENSLLAAEVNNVRGLFASELGQTAEAKRLFAKAIEISTRWLGPDHLDVAVVNENLSTTLEDNGEIEAAFAAIRTAQRIREASLPEFAMEHVRSELALSELYLTNNQYPQAHAAVQKALRDTKLHHADDHETLGDVYFQIAEIYSAEEKTAEAERWYELSDLEYDEATKQSDLQIASKRQEEAVAQVAQMEPELTARSAKRDERLSALGVTDEKTAKVAAKPVNYSMVIYPTERMLITNKRTSIMDGDEVLQTVPSGTRLWTVEKRGAWSKVFVHEKKTFGWISAASADDLLLQIVKQMQEANARRNATNPNIKQQRETLVAKQLAAFKLYQTQGAKAAQAANEEVAELYMAYAGPDDFAVIQHRSRLANTYFQDRQFVKCRKLVEAALPHQRKAYGSDHPIIATELSRLAGLLATIGDVTGSLSCREEALQIAERHLAPDDTRLKGLRMSLAHALSKTGAKSRASAIFQKLLEAESKVPDGPTPVMPSARAGLGNIKVATGEYEEGAQLLRQAAEEYAVLGNQYQYAQGNTLFELGGALLRLGRTDQAEQALDQAQTLMLPEGKGSVDTKISLSYARSGIATRERQWTEALRLTQETIDLTSSAYRQDNVLFRELLAMRGGIHTQLGNLEKAAKDFDRSRQLGYSFVVNTLADQPVSTQTRYIKFADNQSLHNALSLAQYTNDQPEYLELSSTWLLNSKNIANELAARNGQILKLLKGQGAIDNYERWLDTRKRLTTLPKLTPEEAASHDLQNVEEELRNQERQTFDRLPASVQTLVNNQRNGWVQCSDVRDHLRPDEVFVDMVRMNVRPKTDANAPDADAPSNGIPSYVAWVIPPVGRGDVSVVSLGPAAQVDKQMITPLLDEIGRSLTKRQLIGDEEATRQLNKLSATVTDAIWKPLSAKFPADAKKVILCPDSTLWRIPWPSLPAAEDRFLIEDFEFRFVSSGRTLLAEPQVVADLNSPLILADPDYGAADANRVDAIDTERLRSLTGGKLQPFDASFLRDSLPDIIAPLPGTAHEANTIQPELDAWSGARSQVLLRAEASEAAFRLVNRPHTLFIGTHGFFFPEITVRGSSDFTVGSAQVRFDVSQESAVNPLRRCGLLLAGCSDEATAGDSAAFDGILTGEEIVAQDLRGTKLVVLSACETGIGDLIDGQGVAGLRQAIQLAGAESVVSTLWSIEDNETAALMTEFFRNLAKGSDKSEALRQAQLTRIELRRNRFGAAHPFFWAAFTLTGQK